jgi:signal transduction histidine kinase
MMNESINVNKLNFLLGLLISIIFISSIFTYINIEDQKKITKNKINEINSITQNTIDGNIIFFRRSLSQMLRQIIKDDKEFQNSIINHNLDKTKELMNKHFKKLKKINRYINTFQYISTNNISIYRAHRPKLNSDDLSLVRPIIVNANKLKRSRYGFENGKTTMAYRIVIPLIYNKIHYGVIELGADPKLFVSSFIPIKDKFNSTIIIIKQAKYNNISIINNRILHNKEYYIIEPDKFYKSLFPILKINHISEFINLDNKYFSIFKYILKTYDDKVAGAVLMATNITKDYQQLDDQIIISIIKQLILSLVIILIVFYAFSLYDKKINELYKKEKEHEQTLAQQAKLAAMGEMIGNIAHQWRQPLSVVSTISSGMKVQDELGILTKKDIAKSTDDIVKYTQYMSKTIDDFRDFFKQDKEKTTFVLEDTLIKDLELMKASFTNNYIKIIHNIDSDIKIYGLKNELTQAFLNILNNAKDQLSNLNNTIPRQIIINAKEKNNTIYITITDNAGGIDEQILPKIFEPYFTTKHQNQGTGIGLYMTTQIINKHYNGKIYAKNTYMKIDGKKYKGAQFTIELPNT